MELALHFIWSKHVAFSVTAISLFALYQNGFDSAFCVSYCVALFFLPSNSVDLHDVLTQVCLIQEKE